MEIYEACIDEKENGDFWLHSKYFSFNLGRPAGTITLNAVRAHIAAVKARGDFSLFPTGIQRRDRRIKELEEKLEIRAEELKLVYAELNSLKGMALDWRARLSCSLGRLRCHDIEEVPRLIESRAETAAIAIKAWKDRALAAEAALEKLRG
jgi:environmental stress-induced protein Ves